MEFIPFTNVVKLEMVFLQDQQYIENVFHYQSPVPLTIGLLEDAATERISEFDTTFKGTIPTNCALVKIKATDLTSDSSPAIEYATGLPLTGTNSSPALPNNVTFVVKWTTGLRGRSYRGRTYHIGLTEGMVTGNTVETSIVDTFNQKYQDYLALTVNGSEWPMVIASRVHNGSPRVTGVATLVTGFSIDPTVDSQRRRLPGRGR